MARGVNKVILIGNLGNDPDVRFTPNGSAVANLSVATSDSWTDKNTGQRQDRTEWHRVVIFNKLAEICQQYLRKGSKVYLEGRLQTRKWQDAQGQDRYSTEIVANDMQMLDSRSEGMSGGAPMGGYQQQQQAAPQQQYSAPAQQQPQQQQQYAAPQAQQRPAAQPAAQQPPQQPPQQAPQQAAAPQAQPAGGFDDFDDDIPF